VQGRDRDGAVPIAADTVHRRAYANGRYDDADRAAKPENRELGRRRPVSGPLVGFDVALITHSVVVALPPWHAELNPLSRIWPSTPRCLAAIASVSFRRSMSEEP